LVATWGNLVNRVLSMTFRTFAGKVPEAGTYDERDERLIARGQAMLDAVAEQIEGVRLKGALSTAMAYAQEANAYLNETEPWKTAKSDLARTATSLYVALCAIAALKVALYPYLPFSSQQIHEYMGLTGDVTEAGWTRRDPVPGTSLREPAPLFKKLDVPDAAEEPLLSA